MSDPRELYQQVILEHNKKPRNFGKLEACTHHAEGHNPLCGDQLELSLIIENGLVQDIKFTGSGCAIDVASAGDAASVTSVPRVNNMAEQFRGMVRGELEPGAGTPLLGKLTLFSGVKDLPSRVKCAVLPWATLHAALKGEAEASTE